MTYVINNYDGTPLVSVPDRTVNTTVSSIRLPGRDYSNYGEPVVENLVWMLQHFAAANAPINAVRGQVWYDTNSQSLKVYNGSTWLGTGKTLFASDFPLNGETGQIFYHISKRQLFVYDPVNSPVWKLVGPIGAYDNNNGNQALPGYSVVDAVQIPDNTLGATFHNILRVVVAGQLVAIISGTAFTPQTPPPGFSSLQVGINLSSTLSASLVGNASSATQAANSTSLGGIAAATYMRLDQSNVPIAGGTDLGANTLTGRYANIYATTFNGTATQALYADVAERYHVNGSVEPGDVVQLGGDHEIELCHTQGSDQVFGVISTNPAIMLNSEAGDDQTHPYVALVGRTPCKVVGAVRKGDRLMAGHEPGTACVWTPDHSVLSILGKSLHTDLNEQVKLVEIVVGVR